MGISATMMLVVAICRGQRGYKARGYGLRLGHWAKQACAKLVSYLLILVTQGSAKALYNNC